MGHLHTQNVTVSDMDKMERLIMGGVELIPISAFHDDIRYVALGHIHKAQCIGKNPNIRYAGSPLPMSFSEINYKHQVIIFDLIDDNVSNIRSLEVPVSVPLISLPAVHSTLSETLWELQTKLPEKTTENTIETAAPYLEVRVLLDKPEPAIRNKIDEVIKNKYVRLVKIDVKYQSDSSEENAVNIMNTQNLNELKPADVFNKIYRKKYGADVPDDLMQLFHIATQEAEQIEE
ncbi:Nuclease SbcCD subunit D [bioreactor metagenome]|uniref:Nuclease SbcCD subunit D n=1 Tax=bioreactor metagenome TaxID=1076179 RepID=A0A645ESW7_9ZZZZ